MPFRANKTLETKGTQRRRMRARLLTGLMPQPVNGPSTKCATSTANPIGIGASAAIVDPDRSVSSGLDVHTATLNTCRQDVVSGCQTRSRCVQRKICWMEKRKASIN